MSGVSGSILQLARMHPACAMPSPLLMEYRVAVASHGAAHEYDVVAT